MALIPRRHLLLTGSAAALATTVTVTVTGAGTIPCTIWTKARQSRRPDTEPIDTWTLSARELARWVMGFLSGAAVEGTKRSTRRAERQRRFLCVGSMRYCLSIRETG